MCPLTGRKTQGYATSKVATSTSCFVCERVFFPFRLCNAICVPSRETFLISCLGENKMSSNRIVIEV